MGETGTLISSNKRTTWYDPMEDNWAVPTSITTAFFYP